MFGETTRISQFFQTAFLIVWVEKWVTNLKKLPISQKKKEKKKKKHEIDLLLTCRLS